MSQAKYLKDGSALCNVGCNLLVSDIVAADLAENVFHLIKNLVNEAHLFKKKSNKITHSYSLLEFHWINSGTCYLHCSNISMFTMIDLT